MWFYSEDEPVSNHLVHLYRELSKENYGVAFAPTQQMPGSDLVCFGNAVFWQRSRWNFQQSWSTSPDAIYVELTSRLKAPPLVVCCSKTRVGYARDWGSAMGEEDLLGAHAPLRVGLSQASEESGARRIWCGDFGASPQAVLPNLASLDGERASSTQLWSACRTVLGKDPWTSVADYNDGQAVDYILHDSSLEVTAVLGGLSKYQKFAEFLQAGYPSDHLLQLAVFRDGVGDSGAHVNISKIVQ